MEDYIRGVLCGYLMVQNGTRDDAKRKRIFAVLSDSRIDYYLTDPRPAFTAKIDATYFLTNSTRVHYYLELNARAPPNSICLTTDKITDVYIADSEGEADTWFRHITERLDALSTMLKGSLMLRKELPESQQVKRFVLRTKYRWKVRYVELGRSTLRFCKQSDHKTKTMKQFALTANSFAGRESTTYLRKLAVLASYSIPVEPTPKTLKGIKRIEKMRREEEERCESGEGDTSNEVRPKGSPVAAYYPFIVTTGQAYLLLAAPTEQMRTHWILAIRLRIIALKYRHNAAGGPRKEVGRSAAPNVDPYQLQGFVEAQVKPGGPWKQHYIELDNGMLRVKKSERKLGSIFEVQLVPTCRVAPLLEKANAFTVRSLGCEVALAPGCTAEARRWMNLIQSAATSVDKARYQRIFHDDIQTLLRHSIVYALDVPSEAKAGLVVEKHHKRIFVLSHEPPAPRSPRRVTMAALVGRVSMLKTATSSVSSRTFSPSSTPSPVESPTATTDTTHSAMIIPQGSVLVGISQFGMVHDSVDTIWHTLRQNKGCYKQAKRLLFRTPAVKEGVLRVKFRAADEWMVSRCRLANGMFRVEDTQSRSGAHVALITLALRNCEAELFSDDDCVNGIKIAVATNGAPPRTAVFMNIAVDDDAFLWFAMLHMEISVAQDSTTFPITAATLKHPPTATIASGTLAIREERLAADQAKSYRDCTVVGTRVDEIEKYAREQQLVLLERSAKNREQDSSLEDPQRFDCRTVGIAETFAALSPADTARFFQQLDAVGSGKVSSAGLLFTMKLITKHISSIGKVSRRLREDNVEAPESSDDSPLRAFFAALDELNMDGRDNLCLTLDEFSAVMAKLTHPSIVELVRKASLNEIQCM